MAVTASTSLISVFLILGRGNLKALQLSSSTSSSGINRSGGSRVLWHSIYPRDPRGRDQGVLLMATETSGILQLQMTVAPANTLPVSPRTYAKVSMLSSSRIPPYPGEGPTTTDNLTQQQITHTSRTERVQAFLPLCPREGGSYFSRTGGRELRGESTAGHRREALPHEGRCPQQRKGTDGH